MLCHEPVLKIFDYNSETELHVDASQEGFGAVLLQKDSEDGQLHPVYYWSRKTNDAQKKYHSYELEVLAVIEALKKFKVYLLGIKFKILTDCSAFAVTMNKKDLCARVARWALMLEEYNYVIEHRPGSRMQHCDALSRNPITMIVRNEFLERIIDAQGEDDNLKNIMKILESQPHENDELNNNILYKEENGEKLLVIPTSMQRQIIKNAHENGHFAVKKTKELLVKEYYIPNLEDKIRGVISNCIPCILAERKTGKQEGMLHPIDKGETPLQIYHIDHLGPLKQTGKGYKHLLVVMDAFTKFVWLYPTKTTSTKEVLEKLEMQKAVFGNPKTIISDRGTAFTSNDFEQYCTEQKIKHIKIATGVPRGNGQVERMNRIIIPTLTKLCIDKPENWYKHIRALQEVLNNTYQRSIGTSPFELLFGVKMSRSSDIKLKEIIEEEYLKMFSEEREVLRRDAREQMKIVQKENVKTYNKRRKTSTIYNTGDLVAIKKTQFQNQSKLLPKFIGPYKILTKMGPDRYDAEKVGCQEGPRKTTTSTDNMKPWVREDDADDPFETNGTQDGRDVGNREDSPTIA